MANVALFWKCMTTAKMGKKPSVLILKANCVFCCTLVANLCVGEELESQKIHGSLHLFDSFHCNRNKDMLKRKKKNLKLEVKVDHHFHKAFPILIAVMCMPHIIIICANT